MGNPIQIDRLHRLVFVLAIVPLLIAALVAPFQAVQASVHIYGFEATLQDNNSILLVWQTGAETGTSAFLVHRGLSPGDLSATIATKPAEGLGLGASYSYTDKAVQSGVRYYYQIEEWVGESGGDKSPVVSAGIDVLTQTPTPTATLAPATATATATVASGAAATSTATATNVPGSGGAATATRRFTNTPPPTAAAAPGVTAAPGAPANPTATPVGAGVVSAPTGGPQPPAAAVLPATATPLPPAALTAPAASPYPEIVATSAVQPALGLTPEATRPLPVFAAATSQPLPGTPGRPTPAPTGEEPRNTRTILLLGGGAIIIAAALGGGALLLSRSRQP